ncbi:hypothetical protein HDU86_006504 [Geranomyces michiganensis]|nr:hypothetical protein HDU86_006504 [Geranomyces michiganensis]
MQVNLVPPHGVPPVLVLEEDQQFVEGTTHSSRADAAGFDGAQHGVRKSSGTAGSQRSLAGPPTSEPPVVMSPRRGSYSQRGLSGDFDSARTLSTQSVNVLKPISTNVEHNDILSNRKMTDHAVPVVPTAFGQRAKSSGNLRAVLFASPASTGPQQPLNEPAYTTGSLGRSGRGRRLSSSGGSGGGPGMMGSHSGVIKPLNISSSAALNPLRKATSVTGSSDVLRGALTNSHGVQGVRRNSHLTDEDSSLNDPAAYAADRKKRLSADPGSHINEAPEPPRPLLSSQTSFLLPIIAPANASRVLPSSLGQPASQWLATAPTSGQEHPNIESNNTADSQDAEDVPDQFSQNNSSPNRPISTKSRSFVLSPPKEARPRGNSLKWAGDGGAKKMNKPIWKPGGMDETAKVEFMKNKAKARAVTSAIGKRKPRTASENEEDDEDEPEEAIETEPREPRPPLELVPHPPLKYKLDRKHVKFTIERPGSGLMDTEGRNLPPLPITSILMYDPPPIRSALRLSRPPKTRLKADGTAEDREDEKPAEIATNMAHSLRTDFIRDFTLLSSHDTTQQDIEMQAMLRDVDAIGVSRPGWSNKAEMYNIDPSEVRNMCKVFYAYIKSERLVERGGLFGNELGNIVVQKIGDGLESGAMVSFLKGLMANLDRARYLYAKAMIGHISRLSALPLNIYLLPHLATALAPMLLPHQLIRCEKEPVTPLIDANDDRPIPGFRFRPLSPPLQSPGIFSPFSFFPPGPALTAAAVPPADQPDLRRPSEDAAFGGVGTAGGEDDAAVVPCVGPLDPAATALMVMSENYDAIFGGARATN